MDITIGIDPGIETGGIAILPEDNSRIVTMMTPRLPSITVAGKTKKGGIDVNKISKIMLDIMMEVHESGGGTLVIVYEDVHNIKGSSSASNFAFGCRKGEIAGAATTVQEIARMLYYDTKVVVEPVYSTTWQKHCIDFTDKVIKSGKTDTKASSISCALRKFPDHSFAKGKGKVPQDGMTDAALIALYGKEVVLRKYYEKF